MKKSIRPKSIKNSAAPICTEAHSFAMTPATSNHAVPESVNPASMVLPSPKRRLSHWQEADASKKPSPATMNKAPICPGDNLRSRVA